jgi:hypothetical protein
MADVAPSVPTTKLLYFGDTYRLTGPALVLQCELDTNGRLDVVLDQTLFYPQGGVSMSRLHQSPNLPTMGPLLRTATHKPQLSQFLSALDGPRRQSIVTPDGERARRGHMQGQPCDVGMLLSDDGAALDVTDVRLLQGVVHHYGTMRDGAPGVCE